MSKVKAVCHYFIGAEIKAVHTNDISYETGYILLADDEVRTFIDDWRRHLANKYGTVIDNVKMITVNLTGILNLDKEALSKIEQIADILKELNSLVQYEGKGEDDEQGRTNENND